MEKTTAVFSKTLFKQDFKSNWLLILVVLIIMCFMCNVINFAMSMMGKEEFTDEMKSAQETFYAHLFVMANYNRLSDVNELTVEDFLKNNDKSVYEAVFTKANETVDETLSAEAFEDAIGVLKSSPVGLDSYVANFEYIYALNQAEGVFSGEKPELEDIMTNMLEMNGISKSLINSMSEMDTTSLLNRMYFQAMGLLPIFLLIVLLGNSMIVDQVDRGFLAYTLSTPMKRSAVAITQMIFMLVIPLIIILFVCMVKIVSTGIFFDEINVPGIIALYLGMYILVEAVSGLCYLGSCFANHSRKSLAFGGGLAVWFFLASLLGVFGSSDLVAMGIGVEQLGVFNKLTLITLFDVEALGTVGSGDVDASFVWKLSVLTGVAIVSYAAGMVKFCRKDLPL